MSAVAPIDPQAKNTRTRCRVGPNIPVKVSPRAKGDRVFQQLQRKGSKLTEPQVTEVLNAFATVGMTMTIKQCEEAAMQMIRAAGEARKAGIDPDAFVIDLTGWRERNILSISYTK